MALTKSKFEEALKILTEETTSIEKFEAARTILSGYSPKIDKLLEKCSTSISKIENIAKGDVISLSAGNLPESTEEEKRRKKAIVLFIKYFRQLKSEVERIDLELRQKDTPQNTSIKLLSKAKGPLGLITLLALGIVLVGIFLGFNGSKNKSQSIQTSSPQIQKMVISVINFNDKQISVDQLRIGTGNDCDSPHYHAKDEISATATDGTKIPDPGGCGYGKLKQTLTQNIQI